MSGFTGLVLFNPDLYFQLKEINIPDIVNGFFPKIEEIRTDCCLFAYYAKNHLSNSAVLNHNSYQISATEGVIFNPAQVKINDTNNLSAINEESLSYIYSLKEKQGSFSGFSFNKESKELFLFVDQTASRQLFYFGNTDFFAFSSSIFLLRDILLKFNLKINLSEPASYMMLSLGYMLEDFTLISEIKKLTAGKYLKVCKEDITIKEYHNFYRKTKHQKITKELLVELDTRFKNSVKSEYQFDFDKGFKHFASLSGGLDSRMNVMTAWNEGYKDITTLTFSQGLQPDEMVARQISDDLKLQQILILLNNGLQLFDIDSPLLLNNCSVYYFGAAQTLYAIQKLNLSGFGLSHNGGLAESSKGGYLSGTEFKKPELLKRYAVSDLLFSRFQDLFDKTISDKYPNDEMFVHYSRGFNAVHNGNWMTRPFTESVNTFMEPKFAELAFSIHPKLRYNAFLTIEWLNTLNKDMAKYNWSNYGIPPTNNRLKLFNKRVLRRIEVSILKRNFNPVPFDSFYLTNILLQKFIDDSFNKSFSWDIISTDLSKDIKNLFKSGTVTEKLLCISYLKSIELLFAD